MALALLNGDNQLAGIIVNLLVFSTQDNLCGLDGVLGGSLLQFLLLRLIEEAFAADGHVRLCTANQLDAVVGRRA